MTLVLREPQDPEGNREAKTQSMPSSEKIGKNLSLRLGVLARKSLLESFGRNLKSKI